MSTTPGSQPRALTGRGSASPTRPASARRCDLARPATGSWPTRCRVLLERDIVDVSVVLAPHAYTIDDVIDWVRRDPWVGDLLRQQEAAVMAQGPDIMAARSAEEKRFL